MLAERHIQVREHDEHRRDRALPRVSSAARALGPRAHRDLLRDVVEDVDDGALVRVQDEDGEIDDENLDEIVRSLST